MQVSTVKQSGAVLTQDRLILSRLPSVSGFIVLLSLLALSAELREEAGDGHALVGRMQHREGYSFFFFLIEKGHEKLPGAMEMFICGCEWWLPGEYNH